MTPNHKARLRGTVAFACKDPLSRKALSSVRQGNCLEALMLNKASIFLVDSWAILANKLRRQSSSKIFGNRSSSGHLLRKDIRWQRDVHEIIRLHQR